MIGKHLARRLPTTVVVLTRHSTATARNFTPQSNESKSDRDSSNFPSMPPVDLPQLGLNPNYLDKKATEIAAKQKIELETPLQTQLVDPDFIAESPKESRSEVQEQKSTESSHLFSTTWSTFKRDLSGLKLLGSIKWQMRRAFRRNQPLHYYFLHWVHTQPNKQCISEIESGRSFTFLQINQLANKYANFFCEKGFRRGDVVGLFMENSADFFALWLGLSKMGVVTAWINSNLKMEPLAHSINAAHASTVVTTPQLLSTLRTTISEGLLPRDTEVLSVGKSDIFEDVHNLCDLVHDKTEPPIPYGHNFESILCYIYTSGTTGNPKAAVIKHFRYYYMTMASGNAFGLQPTDRIYITMPLYHSAAGIIGVGQTIVRGSSAIVRRCFSAQEFWKDAVKHEATVSQYIGEICRYLLAQPSSSEEKKHKIRMMYGNGLRPEIWKEFVGRFGIKQIGEFYGSTEGNSNIVNIDNHVGSCGFIPIYPGVSKYYPLQLVKLDPETNEFCRDEEGLCILCKPGDTGEVVGTISDKAEARFEGYLDQAESDKKVIRNVFRQGDAAFSSGDILYWCPQGYLYFKDRRGDTYRWRGENVSTTEVEGVLQPIMTIEDAAVYGVEVKGREGRAGMIGATLTPDANVEELVAELSELLPALLPTYAIPVFVRICKQVDRTGTNKIKKADLQKQGFDPAHCNGDSLFYWNAEQRQYLPLDLKMFTDIQSGAYSRI